MSVCVQILYGQNKVEFGNGAIVITLPMEDLPGDFAQQLEDFIKSKTEPKETEEVKEVTE
jgi:hypothetical protein